MKPELQQLKIKGTVLQPGDAEYDNAGKVWNLLNYKNRLIPMQPVFLKKV